MYHLQGKARRNSKTYGKFLGSYATIEETLAVLTPEEIKGARSPYVFTHIQLPTEKVITQTVTMGSDQREITCTPQKLWDAIKATH